MRVKIDNMRFQVLQAAWMKDNGKSTQVESGLAKLYNAREAFEVCDMAIQILGGLGYTEESPVGRVWLDARMNRIGGAPTRSSSSRWARSWRKPKRSA